MASYLPGGVDYIPHLQPFRPDFNFYQAALERKEAQYKEGYNKISGLYGTLLNSPMLRDDNNERRDQFFKDVENNIQRISGMDLSLEENVDSAYKVFQPIIDDSNIHKDIVFTKGYQNELQRAEGFRNCLDEKKCGGRWWEDGVRALNYQAEDFKNSDIESAMQMDNPRYTPAVNAYKNGLELSKAMGFSITKSVSQGGYIHTYKNGTMLEGPLKNYLMGTMGNDPAAIDMYRTKAYLARKDYAKVNAMEHGSEDAAESYYLNQSLNHINQFTERNIRTTDETLKIANAKKNVLTQKTQDKQEARFDLDKALQQINELNDQIEKGNSAKGTFENVKEMVDRSTLLGADKKVLRFKVDNAMAYGLLEQEMSNAARDYSDLTYEDKMVADPYGLAAQRHMYSIDEIKLKSELDKDKMALSFQYKLALKGQLAKGGTVENTPLEVKDYIGSSTAPGTYDVYEGFEKQKIKYGEITKVRSEQYLEEVYNHYNTIIEDSSTDFSADQKTIAKLSLKKIFGNYLDASLKIKGTVSAINPNDINGLFKKAIQDTKSSELFLSEAHKNKLAGIESSVDDGWKVWNAENLQLQSNNKEIMRYVNFEAGSELKSGAKDNLNALIDAKGNVADFDQFATKYIQQHGYADPDDIKDLYMETHDGYVALMNSGNPAIKVKAWDGATVLGGGGGGRTGKAFMMHVDGASPLSNSVTSLFSVKNNIDQLAPTDYIAVVGGAKGIPDMETVAGLNESSPQAMRVFNAFMDDLRTSTKGTNAKRAMGTITYAPIAAGNANMTAISITPSEDWYAANKGSDKNPGVAFGLENLPAEGVTVLIPEDKADNAFSRGLRKSQNQIITDSGQPIAIDKGKDGHVTIKKVEQGYRISGTAHGYDTKGKRTTEVISNNAPEDADIDSILNYYDKSFNLLRESNEDIESDIADEEQ